MPVERHNTLDDSFTLNIDLATTIVKAAGLKKSSVMQGRDISDLYLKPETMKPWREEFFYEFKVGNTKSMPANTALVRKKFKYIHWTRYKYEQLFDLETDPLEMNDVVNETISPSSLKP